MNLRHGHYSIGYLKPDFLEGQKAIAAGQVDLGFSVTWTEYAGGRRLLSGTLRLSLPEHGEFACLTLTTRMQTARQSNSMDRIFFSGTIGMHALEIIEKHRNGRDLLVQLKIEVLTDDALRHAERCTLATDANVDIHELWEESTSWPIPATDWLRVLEGMGFRRSLYLETTFPYSVQDKDPLSLRLRRARDAFDSGRYENCIAEVRHVLSELDSRRGDGREVDDAIGKFRSSSRDVRESMSLKERLLVMRRTLEHISHYAHHPRGDDFARVSAKMALILTASILESFPEPECGSSPSIKGSAT